MLRIQSLTTAILATLAIAGPSVAGDIRYTVTDIGTLGGPTSIAIAISPNGIVVGGAEVPQRGNHPYIYQGGAAMQDLGLLDPVNGIAGNARSVNSKAQVVGETDAPGVNRPANAFLYNGSAPLIDLGTLGGLNSIAWGINERGQIVGDAQTASGEGHGVIWTIGGPTIDLGPGFQPLAINNLGQMVGTNNQTYQHAAVYDNATGQVTDLGTLGGLKSQLEAVSDTDLAVGFSQTPVTMHAILYDINTGVLSDLGTLGSPTLDFSIALGVNDLGQVVGGSGFLATGDGVAFIYTKVDGMQDLNEFIDPSSGFQLRSAAGINDAGQIVGSGFNSQGEFHAYLLNPVPEPSMIQLAFAALCVLAGRCTARATKHRFR